jgi:D-beta-D-heptose 7-phosphate kinase/D-beta-D-heptose 1-phosphate adenosyltransferase
MAQAMKIVVVGDVMLDRYVDGRLERFSQEAPVPVFDCDHTRYYPGGAANVAANVAALGENCFLVGCVGSDDAAADLLVVLRGLCIESDLVVCSDRLTTIKSRYCVAGQQIFRTDSETRSPVRDQRVLKAALRALDGASALVISDYGKGVIAGLETRDLVTLLDLALISMPVIVDAREGFWRFRGATVVKPNRIELDGTTASDGVHKQASELRGIVGCSAVVATLGADGMVVANSDGEMDIPAHYREVADVIGAGDTVAAALAVEMARGKSVVQAARFANAAAAVVVGKRGTATATRAETEAVLDADHPRDEILKDYRVSWSVAR